MKKIFVLILLFLGIAGGAIAQESDPRSGDYRLVEHHCPGGIAGGIHFGWYQGTGVVRTSQGYLYSAFIAGEEVIVKNGPHTVCTGRLTDRRFTGSCKDQRNNFCAVAYEKR